MEGLTSERRRGWMLLALLLTAIAGVAALAVVGAPAAAQSGDEIANETVNVTDPANESVWVDVEFAANNSEINATLFDPSGNESANATLVGADGTSDSVEWSVSETGNYSVEVHGNESDVEKLYMGVGSGDGIGVIVPSDDGSGGGVGTGALAALVVAVVVLALLGGRS